MLFLFIDNPAAYHQAIPSGIGLDEKYHIVWRLVQQEIYAEASWLRCRKRKVHRMAVDRGGLGGCPFGKAREEGDVFLRGAEKEGIG